MVNNLYIRLMVDYKSHFSWYYLILKFQFQILAVITYLYYSLNLNHNYNKIYTSSYNLFINTIFQLLIHGADFYLWFSKSFFFVTYNFVFLILIFYIAKIDRILINILFHKIYKKNKLIWNNYLSKYNHTKNY